nr:glycosyltransferase family 39 protein [Saprospiraceae bacterium]
MIVQSRNSQNKIILFYLFIALLFITCIRWRLLDIPLERDEGEYAYMGQLLLKGYPPFSQAYNMKYPGTSFIYAIFITVFGNTIFAIHFGLALVNIFNCILVFKIVEKVLGQTEGLITSTIFGILALSQPFLGFAAHAT